MAVRESVTPNGAGTRRAWFVAACLVVLFVAALFLRAYWNLDAANPAEGEYILSGGSDPYYHKHAVDRILADSNGDGSPDFKHFLGDASGVDPLLNYPLGSQNPNPPLYEWSIAVGAKLIEPFTSPETSASGVTLSSLEVAAWKAALWSPAIFGALTVFTVFALGAALFDRRAGLVAALLWTVATSAVDSGGVGLADHDAAVIFFVTLAMLFYIQALRQFRGETNWVAKWSSPSGLGNLFRERRVGFAYALASAFAIGAVALTWKGFNYVIGILFLYAIIQMVVDHWRNKDSTGLFLATLLAMGGGVLVALPYYMTANVGNFLQPTWYILATFLVAGVVLVPTRDLPTILVLPIAGVVGLALAAVAFFVFPDVAQSLLYATVYFKQTRLYETIAEAHPADFSTVMFGIGPLAFFLAIAGWIVAIFRLHTTAGTAGTRIGIGVLVFAIVAGIAALVGLVPSDVADTIGLMLLGIGGISALAIILGGTTPQARVWGFAVLWGLVAVLMAQSAVRFLINAIPVFCVFAGFMAIWLIDWLDFGAIRKSLAANRGNFWQGFRKGTRPLHVVAVILIALLFVVPTTILAADAALPPEAENKLCREAAASPDLEPLCNRIDEEARDQKTFLQSFYSERMGAYGQGFGQVKPWIEPLEFLKAHDAAITDPAERPAFISWWDYGHWAIAISDHPAVADNFQNGYELAANFILSQDEAHGLQLLAARLAEAPGADLEAAATQAGSANAAEDARLIKAWQKSNLTLDQSAKLLAAVEAQTGKSIRYFATDSRMLPYDNPQTQNVESGSIFYAPVTLKGDEPDDYVTTEVNVGTPVPGVTSDGFVTVPEYEELARNPVKNYQYTGQRLVFQDKFVNSAYWRHYIGTPAAPSPGQPMLGTDLAQALTVGNLRPAYGLEHWRAVYVGPLQYVDQLSAEAVLFAPEIVITEYFHGAVVEGTVTEDGAPLSNVAVTVFDDVGLLMGPRVEERGYVINNAEAFNVPHQQVFTDAEGKFRILAPFSMEGGNVTLAATRGSVQLGRVSLEITREQANGADCPQCKGVSISVARGTVEGTAFTDANGDGTYDSTTDTLAANVELTVGGKTVTTDAEGKYSVSNVAAGTQNVTTSAPGLRVAARSRTVDVQPDATATHNVSLEQVPARITGTLVAPVNGTDTPVRFVTLAFTADATVAGNTASTNPGVITQPDGNFTAELAPGTYVVTATHTEGDQQFELNEVIVLQPGEQVTERVLRMTPK